MAYITQAVSLIYVIGGLQSYFYEHLVILHIIHESPEGFSGLSEAIPMPAQACLYKRKSRQF